ncbi:GNAT family N-acetyltransferase [Nocardioides dubius]|uniref:GNAT family N-acetyltransferase n=1 Tax=Nocardioides dubius TaxID=317019 RepID=A0ABP4EEK5_9ACTN
MLWRVRTTLPDQPGALANLATTCGTAGVNILAMQIFPGIDAVTDEFVLRTADGWSEANVVALVERSGGAATSCLPCSEQALVDQPARHVRAARAVLAQPAAFPDTVAKLLDAEAEPTPDGIGAEMDVMELAVGEVTVQIWRAAPFTLTEHARGAEMAALVAEVLERGRLGSPGLAPTPGRRLSPADAPEFVVEETAVMATVNGTVVGLAALGVADLAPGVRESTLRVDPAWRRRGIGTRLLVEMAKVAAALGLDDISLRTSADNQAVLPMVLSAGLRARIKMSADLLTVQVPVRQLTAPR